MTAWRDIANSEVDPESPLTTSLAVAWTDNVIAHMEGDTSVPAALKAHHLKSVQVFESSDTWTKPASGVGFIKVITVGGGGGGGGPDSAGTKIAEGGTGAAYSEIFIDVSAIASETVTIGAGGSGGGTNAAGGGGGTSTFGAHTSSAGGSGGPTLLTPNGAAGAATPTLGYLKIPGGRSSGANTSGGGSHMGAGAPSVGPATDGENAVFYGAGGAGGSSTGAGQSGGDGKAGVIIVEEYT
jgi:hypothetical protein